MPANRTCRGTSIGGQRLFDAGFGGSYGQTKTASDLTVGLGGQKRGVYAVARM